MSDSDASDPSHWVLDARVNAALEFQVDVRVCEILIDWVIDWSREWVIKVIKGLSAEWVNESKCVSESVFLKRTNEPLFSYIFVY